MNIPLLDLSLQHDPIEGELSQAITRIIKKNAFILGAEVQNFEKKIADYCGTKFAIGVSSGTDALLISLMGLDVKPGDEVITTPFSFFATAGCVSRLGAKPVFVDIDPVTYNIDPEKIEAAISEKTKVILPVHLYGQCADSERIVEIARKHNLKVVEDAAQSLGAQYKDGRKTGNLGDLGCFSFFPTKNLGGFGDGGMVVTNDAELEDRIRILRVHGSRPKYYHKLIGGNFRLDSLQAAVLDVKLDHLESWNAARRENAGRYDRLFQDNCLIETGRVKVPQTVYADSKVLNHHIYNQYVIRVQDRDALRAHMKDQGIGTEVYYPVPFHLQDCFGYLGYKEGDFPEAETACRETLALPVYPGMTAEQQEYVVQTIKAFYNE